MRLSIGTTTPGHSESERLEVMGYFTFPTLQDWSLNIKCNLVSKSGLLKSWFVLNSTDPQQPTSST